MFIGVYGFGAAYFFAPLLGMPFDIETVATAFGSLPTAAKVGIKAVVALPFTFHSINGLRHLMWDTGSSTLPPSADPVGNSRFEEQKRHLYWLDCRGIEFPKCGYPRYNVDYQKSYLSAAGCIERRFRFATYYFQFVISKTDSLQVLPSTR